MSAHGLGAAKAMRDTPSRSFPLRRGPEDDGLKAQALPDVTQPAGPSWSRTTQPFAVLVSVVVSEPLRPLPWQSSGRRRHRPLGQTAILTASGPCEAVCPVGKGPGRRGGSG